MPSFRAALEHESFFVGKIVYLSRNKRREQSSVENDVGENLGEA